jgi:polar amino acid transport system substrate-binding protein
VARRPRTLVALLAVPLLALAACGGDDDATEEGSDGGGGSTLTICSDIPYEPMEFEDPDAPSGYSGFDIDLVQAIADGADRELEVKVTGFDGIFAALDAEQCDAVVSSVTITEERKENMDFSEPYFDSNQSLMVLEENEATYATLADLAGKNIGVQSGTTGEEYAQSNTPDGATITALPGSADLFAALESGTIDAVLQDYPINAYRATQNDKVVLTERIVTDEQYGMAVRTGDTETLTLLNDGLATAKEDGTYEELYRKYFGEAPPAS